MFQRIKLVPVANENKNEKFTTRDNMAQAKIRPIELKGINGYGKDIGAAYFCWRWCVDRNDYKRRVITIEDVPSSTSSTKKPNYRYVAKKIAASILRPVSGADRFFRSPRDFKGKSGYSEELGKAFFCWRRLDRQGTRYRVLTLEDSPQDDAQYQNALALVRPSHLDGTPRSEFLPVFLLKLTRF